MLIFPFALILCLFFFIPSFFFLMFSCLFVFFLPSLSFLFSFEFWTLTSISKPRPGDYPDVTVTPTFTGDVRYSSGLGKFTLFFLSLFFTLLSLHIHKYTETQTSCTYVQFTRDNGTNLHHRLDPFPFSPGEEHKETK